MQNLSSIEHNDLNEKNIKILAQSRIHTILDFLNAEVEKICAVTKLSLPQVLTIRNDIFKKYSAPIISGITLLNEINIKQKKLSTGLKSLDEILDGGLSLGYISEICGLTNSGKTQLCYQLAINCVKNTDNTVLYIDTKGDFSSVRVQKILDSYNLSHKEIAELMYKIKVVQVWVMEELIEIFVKIKNKILTLNRLSLIIIDSLPSLMFQHLGEETKIGLTLLNTFVNHCKLLCSQLQICVICVNIHTRWMNQDVYELGDDKEQFQSTIQEPTYLEKQNRCLGKYWQIIPLVVLVLEKHDFNHMIDNESNCSVINVNAINSTNELPKQCILKLNTMGLSVTNL